jgi:methylated-DNA-[protein]-cysteine S-methyltransferase
MRRRFSEPLLEAQPPAFVQAAVVRVQRLLEGARDDLCDLPLDLATVPEFHRRVYEVARAIPPGEVLTYGEVARRLGDPGASRAVGQALGANPFAPVVPCHRVLAAGGRSGGFSAEGGALTKLKMLEIEGARLGGEPGLFD